MATTEVVVHNSFYCFGCRRSLLVRGLGCWTKVSDRLGVGANATCIPTKSIMVETLVECHGCEVRRTEGSEGRDHDGVAEMKAGKTVTVGDVLLDEKFHDVVRLLRKMYEVKGDRRITTQGSEGDDEIFIAVDYGRAIGRDLPIPVVSMEQVLKGFERFVVGFTADTFDFLGLVADETEDFIGDDEAWNRVLDLGDGVQVGGEAMKMVGPSVDRN
jgi:hypothetical protein